MKRSDEDAGCPSCGAALSEAFCPHCGEQRPAPERRTLSHFVGEMVENLTSLDGKLWRTLWLLLRVPGQLEFDYHRGKRVVHFKPIALFFLVNVIFVMLSPINDFYVSFSDQLNNQAYSGWLRPWLEQAVAVQGWSLADFAAHYDQLVRVLARSLVIVQVPFFAIFAAPLFARRGYFAGDHLVFALNIHTWLMLWIVLAQGPAIAVVGLFNLLGFSTGSWLAYFLIFLAGFLVYLLLASRRMYQLSGGQALWRLPLLVLALLVAHQAYRLCQLVITLAIVQAPG